MQAKLRYATLKLLTALALYTSITGSLRDGCIVGYAHDYSDVRIKDGSHGQHECQQSRLLCVQSFSIDCASEAKASIDAAIAQFGKAVKSCVVTRASTKEEERLLRPKRRTI